MQRIENSFPFFSTFSQPKCTLWKQTKEEIERKNAVKLYDILNYYSKRTSWYLKHWLQMKAIFTWCWCWFFRSNDQMQIDLNVDDNMAKGIFFSSRLRFHLISLAASSIYVFEMNVELRNCYIECMSDDISQSIVIWAGGWEAKWQQSMQ